MTDALMPPAFLRLRARPSCPTIDLTIHFRAPPPDGRGTRGCSGLHVAASAAGGVVEEDGELWSEDGVLLAQSRQLAMMREPR